MRTMTAPRMTSIDATRAGVVAAWSVRAAPSVTAPTGWPASGRMRAHWPEWERGNVGAQATTHKPLTRPCTGLAHVDYGMFSPLRADGAHPMKRLPTTHGRTPRPVVLCKTKYLTKAATLRILDP